MNINAQPVKILLIDDDEINNFVSVKLIKRVLYNTDINISLNGRNGLNILEYFYDKRPQDVPDYILLDINMPVMNGWEFMEEYTKLNLDPLHKTKIFILSSSVFTIDIIKSKNYPTIVDFVSKPLNMEKIRDIFAHELAE